MTDLAKLKELLGAYVMTFEDAQSLAHTIRTSECYAFACGDIPHHSARCEQLARNLEPLLALRNSASALISGCEERDRWRIAAIGSLAKIGVATPEQSREEFQPSSLSHEIARLGSEIERLRAENAAAMRVVEAARRIVVDERYIDVDGTRRGGVSVYATLQIAGPLAGPLADALAQFDAEQKK